MKKTVLFDSFAWIEWFSDSQRSSKVEEFQDAEIIVSAVNLFEVYSKLLESQPMKANTLVAKLISLSRIVPVTSEIALGGAKLRKKYGFSMADAIILATAIQEKAVILTGDKDFLEVTETKIEMI